eukprot:GILJ01001031.1.p1 GENE.GILJ01001031.1~~GILJ01001031.1.p1  ORF type:complete len:195 (+),score=18.08 GILJ01001031.1:69-587(+)
MAASALAAPLPTDKVEVTMNTNKGTIELLLYPNVAPKAVENFVGLANSKYYDNLIFHRVIQRFMIQGGDPTGTGSGGQSIWSQAFEDEVTPQVSFNRPGMLAMANSGPNTNGSQYFITTAETPWLNNKHTIFGEVVKGYDTVTAIERTATGPNDRPIEPQRILSMQVRITPQ